MVGHGWEDSEKVVDDGMEMQDQTNLQRGKTKTGAGASKWLWLGGPGSRNVTAGKQRPAPELQPRVFI